MKKVLFITKSMACGGVERTLLNLIKCLDRNKYSVDLLLVEKAGEFLDMVPDDVQVIQADMPESWRTILVSDELGFKNGFLSIWKNRKYLTAIRFLLVSLLDRMTRRLFNKSALFSACCRHTKLPADKYDIVCDYHGYAHYTTHLAHKFEQAKKFSWIHIENIDKAFNCIKKLFSGFDGFFCVAPKCLDNFHERFPEIDSNKLILLYNLLDKENIISLSQQEPSVKYNTDGRFVITSVGRLSTQKGFDLALSAAHTLKQQGRRFLWIIVGEGPERQNLENLIEKYGLQNDLILHGIDCNPYVYMAIADIYVQSSRYEGFVTTLSEAIVLNKPIVSTSFSGVEQQVYDGKNGVLASFDNDDLASKIVIMMDDEEFRLSCAKGCSEIKLPMDETLSIIDKVFND